MNTMSNDWITTVEAAEIAGYKEEYVRKLARDGQIVSQKFGHAVMISKKSLLEYRERMKERS